MNLLLEQPAQIVVLGGPPDTKWEQEREAFRRMLPNLLANHPGQFVAIHAGQVVGVGADKLHVALDVLANLGRVDIYVGKVTMEPEFVARSGVRREVGP